MPREYDYKPGGYQYTFNIKQQREGFDEAHLTIEKYRENRNIIYQNLESLRDEINSSLRIIKSWLRKYPNLEVARDAADELGIVQESIIKSLDEVKLKMFLEGEINDFID